MEVSKGDIVSFVDGTFPQFIRFVVREVTDGLLLLECGEIRYCVGNIHPSQVKVVE